MTALPTLPRADRFLMEMLRSFSTGATWGTQQPFDMLDRLPFGVAHRFGGATTDPRWTVRATCSIDVWAGTRKAAEDAAFAAHDGILAAIRDQTVFPTGHLGSRSEVISDPAELRTNTQADNVWRFHADYSLVLRPAANPS